MFFRRLPACIFAAFLLFIHQTLTAQTTQIYEILDQEHHALQCRVDLIQQAQQEILLTSYIYSGDLTGNATLQLLLEAAERGVKVRLLLDDWGNRLPEELMEYLAESPIEVRIFNIQKLSRIRTLINRMHEKCLITDQRQLILGGRNVDDDYFALSQEGNFLDREVLVASDSAVNRARLHFYYMWNNTLLTGVRRGKPLDAAARENMRQQLAAAPVLLAQKTTLQFNTGRNWLNGATRASSDVHFIHDDFFEKKNGQYDLSDHKDFRCTDALIALINTAKFSIDIENAYFIPTKKWLNALKAAKKRGVSIRLLTNSAYTNDVSAIHSVYRYNRKRYLKAGIEIWEYRGRKVMHTKAVVIDRRISVVGSYNLDRKSQYLNTEIAVWVDDPAIAARHLALMEQNMYWSVKIGETPSRLLPAPSDTQIASMRRARRYRMFLAPIFDRIF